MAEKKAKNVTDSQITHSEVFSSEFINKLNLALEADLDLALQLLENLHKADLADFIANSSKDKREVILKLLQTKFNAEILVELDPTTRSEMIKILTPDNLLAVAKLDIDKVTCIIEELEEFSQKIILAQLTPDKLALAEKWLAYPENSAGRLMRPEFVALAEGSTIGEAIEYLRKTPILPSEFYEIYVVDHNSHPKGSVLISRLMRSQPESLISEIMRTDITSFKTSFDQEEVCYNFRQYGLVSAPVVSDENILVGSILIDDVVDVIEEEAEEDIMQMVGVEELDLQSSFISTAKKRFPWLFVNLMIAFMTSAVISYFHDTIQHLITLAAIMPIVASLGGNAGTQSLTIAVRALAHKELTIVNSKRVILREVKASLINGLILAIMGSIIITIRHKDLGLSLIFAVAVIINFIMAGLFGSVIPIALSRKGTDPAVASTVFLTALTDTIGFFSFLALAALFLK